MIPESVLHYYTQESQVLSCMSVACGTDHGFDFACDGVKDLEGTPVRLDSIYDLASLSKLFTGLLVMRMHEQNKLNLDAPITAYAHQFTHLNQLTVRQAAWFQRSVRTPERIDQARSREEALEILFSAFHQENGRHVYSDIPAMILKYVLENASGLSYMALLRREILDPLGMRETFCRVPEKDRWRCVSTDREHRIEKGRYILRAGIAPGTPHDPKARLLYNDEEDCLGHAGLFSTATDLIKLCQGIISGNVLAPESLRFMSENHIGHRMPDGTFSQCLGCLCFVRHPDPYISEIPVFVSDAALAWSGFAGNYLVVDPVQSVFELYLGSRVLNRVSVIIPNEGESLTDYGLKEDGTGTVMWPDGRKVISSVNYAYLKDRYFHPPLAPILKQRMQG